MSAEIFWFAIAGWGLAVLLLIMLLVGIYIAMPFRKEIIANWRKIPMLLYYRRNGVCDIYIPKYKGGAVEIQDGENRTSLIRVTDEPAHRFKDTIIELGYEGCSVIIPPAAAASVYHEEIIQGAALPDTEKIELPLPRRPCIFDITPLIKYTDSTSECVRAYVDTALLIERDDLGGNKSIIMLIIGCGIFFFLLMVGASMIL